LVNIIWTYNGEINLYGNIPLTTDSEESVARKPVTCGFCFRASDWSKIFAQAGYCHFEAKYAATLCSFQLFWGLFMMEEMQRNSMA